MNIPITVKVFCDLEKVPSDEVIPRNLEAEFEALALRSSF